MTRFVLEVKHAEDLERGDSVLLSVHPLRTARVLGVQVDRAADHPAWAGGDQWIVSFDSRDAQSPQGVVILQPHSELLLLVETP